MPTQGFTVRVNGTEADIERVEVQGSSVSLDLEESDFVEFGETVTVAYSPPSSGKLQDALGNTVSAIAASVLTVRNNVPDPNETDPPVPIAATVIEDGSLVRVVFNEPLEFSELPPGAVAGLAETTRGKNDLTWSWMAPAAIDNVAGAPKWYEYRYRAVNGSWGARRRITATSIKVTGLSTDTSYDIEVRAGNDAGPGQATQDRAQTLPDLPILPVEGSWRRSTDAGIWFTAGIAADLGITGLARLQAQILRNGSWTDGRVTTGNSTARGLWTGTRRWANLVGLSSGEGTTNAIRWRGLDSGGNALTSWYDHPDP